MSDKVTNIIYTDSPDAANQIVKWINSGEPFELRDGEYYNGYCMFHYDNTLAVIKLRDRRDPMQEKTAAIFLNTKFPNEPRFGSCVPGTNTDTIRVFNRTLALMCDVADLLTMEKIVSQPPKED